MNEQIKELKVGVAQLNHRIDILEHQMGELSQRISELEQKMYVFMPIQPKLGKE